MLIVWPFRLIIDHLVSGCPNLAKTEYINRQNKATEHLYWKRGKEFGIDMSTSPRLSLRTTAAPTCGTCPFTLKDLLEGLKD